jgi:NodT family efflux transporter outer membrane factor (OMF) lipoprotein
MLARGRFASRGFIAIAAGVALAGCVDPPSTRPEETLAHGRDILPDRFEHAADAGTAPDSARAVPATLVEWPRAYGDARLDELVAAVLAANHDLEVAAARLREARAGAVETASVLWPTLDLNSFSAHSRQLRNTGTPNRIVDAEGIDAQASWELDLFGGNGERARAARLDAESAQANLWGVHVALVAETATSYLELAGIDERLAVLDRNIALQREGLRLATGAFKAGLAVEPTVERAMSRLASTRALRPPLEQTRASLVHRLAVLAGTTPEAMSGRLASPVALPNQRPADPQLAPSELLSRRPDMRAAEAQLFAAAARSKAARTDLLPKFFLTGSYGEEQLSVARLITLTHPVYLIGSSVALPIFNAGRIRARIAGEDAKLDAAAASYEQTLLKALVDVENAYAGIAAAKAAHARLTEAASEATTAEEQTRRSFELGRVDYTTLLDVERERLAAEDGEVEARTASAVAYASLFRAFGGGWDVHEAARAEGELESPVHCGVACAAIDTLGQTAPGTDSSPFSRVR